MWVLAQGRLQFGRVGQVAVKKDLNRTPIQLSIRFEHAEVRTAETPVSFGIDSRLARQPAVAVKRLQQRSDERAGASRCVLNETSKSWHVTSRPGARLGEPSGAARAWVPTPGPL